MSIDIPSQRYVYTAQIKFAIYNYIFSVDNLHVALDLVGLAMGYGLPHLPKMPELKYKDTSSFISHRTPASSIPYKDKAREKKRKQQLLEKRGRYSTWRVSSCNYYGWCSSHDGVVLCRAT